MDKHQLRQQLLGRRKKLDPEACQALSLQIQKKLLAARCFRQAQTMALYSPVHNEVQTSLLLEAALDQGKQTFFPRVCGDRMRFLRVLSPTDLAPGHFGVAEPTTEESIGGDQLDLILVPGIAFDHSGHRLGYGKGFYDRELAQATGRSCRVGLCYQFQLCSWLPRETHDLPVHVLVTEEQIISCRADLAGSL